MIQISNLTVSIQNKKIVSNVNLNLESNEIVGLVGGSGSGKSTIFKSIFNSSSSLNAYKIDGKILIPVGRVQPVFQDAYSSFNPFKRIKHSILESYRIYGWNLSEGKNLLTQYLEWFSFNVEKLEQYPNECSGGEMQRFGILRAILSRPEYLIMDEPISGLDHIVRRRVINLILDLKRKLGLGILFISHDLDVVEQICDRIYVINQGKIIEEGKRGKIPNQKSQLYTKELFNPWLIE
jgi:peptide/nickel transport system ATP-binding protein